MLFSLFIIATLTTPALSFAPLKPSHGYSKVFGVPTAMRYQANVNVDTDIGLDSTPFAVEYHQHPYSDRVNMESYEDPTQVVYKKQPLRVNDPAMVEFADSKIAYDKLHPVPEQYQSTQSDGTSEDTAAINDVENCGMYPFALMMQGSAPYIAAHAGSIAVFHIPGELLMGKSKDADALLSDIALAWLLGMKIVLVVASRYDSEDSQCSLDYAHECHNFLTVTDKQTLRKVEEEAGYLRTEVERKFNRYLRMHGAGASTKDAPGPEGNVVSGNFYTAQTFGVVRGEDFEYTGFTSTVHAENIENVLDGNDVVLLTTVGLSPLGELVNVNGYHLAASVAASLNADKVVYMANEGCVLQKQGEDLPIQELPLSFAQSLADYHNVQVHNTGFATFEHARTKMEPKAVEMLLHLSWSAYALENGVHRAHIVNPGDGALLEELYTSKNGANTCLYHDKEDFEEEEDLAKEDWDDFFASAAAQGQQVSASFG